MRSAKKNSCMDNEDNLNVYIKHIGENQLQAVRADGWLLAYCIKEWDDILTTGTDGTQKGRDALQLLFKRVHEDEEQDKEYRNERR